MPQFLLRVVSGLSIGIEINFINGGLPRRAWRGGPYVAAQLDLAGFLHGGAAPIRPNKWGQSSRSTPPQVAATGRLRDAAMRRSK
jgi:hypothetical protein